MDLRKFNRVLVAALAVAFSVVVATPASAVATASWQANPNGTVTVTYSGVTTPAILLCTVGAPVCTEATALYFFKGPFIGASPDTIFVGEAAQRRVGGTDAIVRVEAGTYKFVFTDGGVAIATLNSATLGGGGTATPGAVVLPPVEHTLGFNANGGACNSTNSGPIIDGVWIQVPTAEQCSRPGFRLLGWNPKPDGSDPLGFDPGGWTLMTGDNTLFAIWVPSG
jgi:hypothetical protein